MATNDFLRPLRDPARAIYDAFQAEAAQRAARTGLEWVELERMAVWRAARDYAQQHGLHVPTLDQIQRAEIYAAGSADYGAVWAYQVERAMQETSA